MAFWHLLTYEKLDKILSQKPLEMDKHMAFTLKFEGEMSFFLQNFSNAKYLNLSELNNLQLYLIHFFVIIFKFFITFAAVNKVKTLQSIQKN